MKTPGKTVFDYKVLLTIIEFILVTTLFVVVNNDSYSVSIKIIIGLIIVIIGTVIWIWVDSKMNSLKCPKCKKPILLKRDWFHFWDSTNPTKKCYFCNHEFK